MKITDIVRIKNIEFHVENNDYFGTLATVLDLLRQKIETHEYKCRDTKLLEKLRDELLHLQHHYEIVKQK